MASAAAKLVRRRVWNALFVVFCLLGTAAALSALALILWSLLSQGIAGLDSNILRLDTPAPGSVGGLRNAIVGSLLMNAVAIAIAIVVGILAGTWLAEYSGGGLYANTVRFVNDVLLSAPSVLIGLFVYQLAVRPLGGFSGYAGALALALIAAPVITRTTEDVLRLQSMTLREAAIGMGSPTGMAIRKVLWRAATTGILTGGLLAFSRISGETAPLLFTSLNNQFLNLDMTEPMGNLPVVIFNFALSAYDDWRRLAWAAALLIAAAVLTINIIARLLSRKRY